MSEEKQPTIYFQEVQRFRQAWLWILLVVITSVVAGSLIWMMKRQFVDGAPFGDPPMSDAVLLWAGGGSLFFNALLLVFFAIHRLQTEVSSEGFFIRFRPYHGKVRKLDLDTADGIEAIRCSPLMEYGGWGLRLGRRFTAYNLQGNEGIRIYYPNGCHIYVGSQHAEALEAALHQITDGRLLIGEGPESETDD